MKGRLIFLLAPLLCIVAVSFWPAQQATAAVIEQTVAQLAANSTDIVSGEVLSKESQWNDSKTFIFTTVSIRVNELLKGELDVPSTIQVVVPGGEVGEIGLGVEHAARFQVGEDVIVFLSHLEDSIYDVTAWEQGKYTLEDGQVKEKHVSVSSFKEEIRKALK